MNDENEVLVNTNDMLIGKWSEYIRVSRMNGKTDEELRERLRSNNLTDAQIEMLFNPASRAYLVQKNTYNKGWRIGLGILFMLLGLGAFLLISIFTGAALFLGGLLLLFTANVGAK